MLKKLLVFFVTILIVFSFSVSVIAESTNTYKDSVTGVSFTIPQGWNEAPLNEEREYIKVKCNQNEQNIMKSLLFTDILYYLPEMTSGAA